MAPLVGLEAASLAERQELFTAWRRFLEGLAFLDEAALPDSVQVVVRKPFIDPQKEISR